ncbi:DUF2339 domain-containing protein [Candidatus Electronema sp. PJ]|uniref:DUF2339 domain-containing protein n=1 Tax=Candidatus Electronema sp. PJ TaxID=3401572 RepID=UPI003AA9C9CB
MLTVISVIAGGILLGLITSDCTAGIVGMFLGYLLVQSFRQKQKLANLEQRLGQIEELLTENEQETPVEEQPEVVPVFSQAEPAPEPRAAVIIEVVPPSLPRVAVPEQPSLEERLAAKVKAFFTEGNVVLRVGLLVLFFGVAFLLKYAADRNVIPIELRLLGVAMGGIALLGFGWRQRLARPGFALLVQGGGIGILYLTIFAAFKLYHLVPSLLAFAVMLGLVVASTALALLQDSSPLALFGAAGGFLAPVLLSTGSGSHVALFSYYALLNSGILAVSWFKAWRSLNLLGFIFTLGIGAPWGLNSYRPEHFATAEPFLILFFLMFNAIGVLFAFRQPPNLRGYVDGTLVFGTPVICFSLQAGMVQKMPHGLAFSALAVSIFYVGLAFFLWNKGNERLRQGMRTLTEAFLALGIVFVTLAVPLALSGRWAAVTWAMEGAALIWVGIRQNRFLARSTGFLLQFAAGVRFLVDLIFYDAAVSQLPVLNGAYLGAVIIALAAFFSSWQLYKADKLRRCEKWHHLLLFFWGCLWWFCAGRCEINRLFHYSTEDHINLLFTALSCVVLTRLAARLHWKTAAWPGLFLPLFMVLMALERIDWQGHQHLFANEGWLVWPLAFVLLHDCLRQGRNVLKERCLFINHIIGFLLLTLIVTAESSWLLHRLTAGEGVWKLIVWGLMPAGMVLLVHNRRLERFWPLADYVAVYQRQASGIVAVFLWLWLLAGCFGNPGNAAPLPFIPVLNPLELSQIAVMLLLAWWTVRHRADVVAAEPSLAPVAEQVLAAFGAGTAFIWLNAALARAVHHLAGVPFDFVTMLDSRLYQAAVSILWGLLALVLMVTADRRQSRSVWFIGTVLIGATVLKLFLIDLASSGTVERIISFISVGILVIVISYFSPLPPKKEEQ